LPSADSDGQSDPYIIVWDSSKTVKKTRMIEDNNNPLFYDCVELEIEATKLEELPLLLWMSMIMIHLIKMTIFAEVLFLGKCSILRDDTIPEPKWNPCRLKAGAPV